MKTLTFTAIMAALAAISPLVFQPQPTPAPVPQPAVPITAPAPPRLDILQLTELGGDPIYIRCRDIWMVEDFAAGRIGRGAYVSIAPSGTNAGKYVEVRESATLIMQAWARSSNLVVGKP